MVQLVSNLGGVVSSARACARLHHRVGAACVDHVDSSACVQWTHLGVLVVPRHRVHRHLMRLVRLQVLAVVRLGALVDVALLGAHHEQVVVRLVEV